MDFINSRKYHNDDAEFVELRRKKYQTNITIMIMLHGLGYVVVLTFFMFPIIELVNQNTYRFPQPLYIPIEFENWSWTVYGAVYVFICFAIHNSGVLTITTCLLHSSLAEFLTVEFEILGKSLESGSAEEDSKCFKKWIEHHQELLK